jgi:hypothetical protein
MTKNKLLREFEHREGLHDRILSRIHTLRVRAARIRLILFGSVSLGAMIGTVPAYAYLAQESVQSGFNEYLTLMQTDADLLALYWKELLFTLIDSFPLVGTTLLLSALFLLLWTLPNTITAMRIIMREKTFATQ